MTTGRGPSRPGPERGPILVAGATGLLGREICRRLTLRGHGVRGLVRPSSDPEVLASLRDWGVRLVEGDLREPASLAPACRGAETVVSTVTAMRSRQSGDDLETTDLRGQSSLVRVAETEGVDGFVYLSFSGGVGGDEPLTRAKRATEERLRTSRLRSLVLRPSFFMEVWLGPALGFDYAQGRVTIYGTGEKPISWISLGDVAELVVRSLDDPLPNGEALELGGPEPVSPNEAVRIFEETAGRVFEVQRVPEDELRRRAESTEPIQRAFASLLLSYAAGDVVPVKETLRLHPLRLLGVREYARGVLQTPRAT